MVIRLHAPPTRAIALDGREVDLLHYIYSRPDFKQLRGNPTKVISAIDDYASQFNKLMNVGPVKAPFIKNLIAERQPATMIELGTYIGYSAIVFGDAVRTHGGKQYLSIEENPEMAAVANQLVDLAGLRDHVRILVGSSSEVLTELIQDRKEIKLIDMAFIDHCKEAYLPDLWLLEDLGVLVPGKSVIVADNMIYPGNPEYMEWVRASPEQKREIVKKPSSEVGSRTPNTDLVYETVLTEFATSFGKDGIAVTKVV
ncbi:hypothetical protein DL765_006919 [Monosporascus sp. GIB2]|nr:hypothetical protein DL765_006919 [Monosporascus sp. GIB2]